MLAVTVVDESGHELIERFPLYEQRLVVRPGVTGWAQVKGSYASSFEDIHNGLEKIADFIKKNKK